MICKNKITADQLCRTSILIRGLETCYAIFWATTLATIQKKKLLATFSLELKFITKARSSASLSTF